MIEKKVTKTVYRADIEKIKWAHEYVLNMKNVTAKRCYVARELFKTVLDSITTQEEERIEEILETEEEAKAILGKDFVERMETVITYCEKNRLNLLLHGTSQENIPNILEEGLKCHTNDLSYTSLYLSKEGLYSRLLNWPHRRYKGIIMLAIPCDCTDIFGNGLLPIWNGKNGGAYATNYELSPEFILGGLDIEHKSVIMNGAFSCEHDYSKFRLKDNEDDKLIVPNADEIEEDIDSSDWDGNDAVEEPQNTNGEIKQEDNYIPHSNHLNNPIIRTLIEEGKIFISSIYTPKTNDAQIALYHMCDILAFWKSGMEKLRTFIYL
ncbi:MAG: hypothetical protein J6C46_06765 [Clostridia bacterium]|nr:hypothetical protein [Clostridia bacterium]